MVTSPETSAYCPRDKPDNSAVVNIGLMGLGVVGTGVAAHILGSNFCMADVTGCTVNLKKVLVRDASLTRDVELPEGVLTTNAEDILADPDIHIVVEVMKMVTSRRKCNLNGK